MKILSWSIALALALLLSGCMARGSTPEQQAAREQNDKLLEEARAGKIKWIDYARESNANAMKAYPRDNSPETQEGLAYRVVLAQQVDEKKITPEQFDYEWKKYLADQHRQAMANAAAILAASPQPIIMQQPIIPFAPIPHPVSCFTTGNVTTCY